MRPITINLIRQFFILFLLGFIMACANTPQFDTKEVDKSLTPKSVIAEPKMSSNKMALWGGTILDTRNLKDSTQIEVLAYPLDSSHRPLQDKKPLGRFIVQHQGYLEPTTYAQGKLVSILGKISGKQEGKIGESHYSYPVISAQKLHLWSNDDGRNKSSFHFGIGIQL